MPKRKLPPNEEVIALYRSGLSSGEIAERFNVAPVTVSSLLSRIGEPLRSPKEASAIRTERGRTNPARYWLGKKQPPEMVERRIGKIRGERHWLWKGGRHDRSYRRLVEKGQCQQCGSTDDLSIHHVDFDHYNNDPGNLTVLCAGCHMSLHKQAYWDAVHAGLEPPKSNGPVGWQKRGGDAE